MKGKLTIGEADILHTFPHIIRLGEALSDSEIEKNDNSCGGRRTSSGTTSLSHSSRKSLKARPGLRRRHNSSSSDGSTIKNLCPLAPLNTESLDATFRSMYAASYILFFL